MSSHIKSIVGKENYFDTHGDKLAYSSDASLIECNAKSIVMPAQADEIRRIISFANRENFSITIRGAGTGLAGGCVPNNDMVMDLSRMNRIIELDRKNKWVVVEPGVVLDDLNNLLKKHDLIFPIQPASHKVCQIGGMVSTNASGTKAIKYGSTKDWIVDLEVVDGSGKFHALGVKKNMQDFIGSEGTYGVITKARLKLTTPKEVKSMTFLRFENSEKLADEVENLKKDKDVCSIEFFDPICASKIGLESHYHIISEHESNKGKIKDKAMMDDLIEKRESLGPILSSQGFIIMEDPELPAENIPEFLDWLKKENIPVFGHIASGIIHPRFTVEQKEKVKEMLKKVVEVGGKVSGEHGIGLSKKEFISDAELIEKKGLKYKYDSNFILNKGKVI